MGKATGTIRIYVKNMTTDARIAHVREALDRLSVQYLAVEGGFVHLAQSLSPSLLDRLTKHIRPFDMDVLENPAEILADRIRSTLVELIHFSETIPSVRYSEYLRNKLAYDYTYLSAVFSSVQHITIRRFIILNKIERAKRMLLEGRLNLTQIAFVLNYSSVAHLSLQFKNVTGVTPTGFRRAYGSQIPALAAEPRSAFTHPTGKSQQ